MNKRIDIKGLARFETGEDGASISLIAEDVSGRSIRLTFPTDVLSSLIMTLPQMVTAAVQRRRNDPSAGLSIRWPSPEQNSARTFRPEYLRSRSLMVSRSHLP